MTTTRRCDFPYVPDEPERLDWCAWFTRHGIDPHDVAVSPGWVEADDEQRTVTFLRLARDENGHIMIDQGRCDARKAAFVVQLEAPALPWPAVDPC